MKKFLKTIFTCFVLLLVTYFCSIGVKGVLDGRQQTADSREVGSRLTADIKIPAVCELPSAISPAVCNLPSAVFITGPVVADVGELCVFRLSDPTVRADWAVIRQSPTGAPVPLYIDTSGAALTFASNIAAQYTIVAAVIEEGEGGKGQPKILKHICQYGSIPEPFPPGPNPGPGPNPEPTPPPPPATLTEWVRQNVPDAGRADCAALASIYTATADAIDKGTIRSQTAAFSSIRTNTQAKIKPGIWEKFFDELTVQIESKLGGSTEIKPLGLLFQEVADGLKFKAEDEIPEDSSPASTACLPCVAPPVSSSPPVSPSRYPANSRFQFFRNL